MFAAVATLFVLANVPSRISILAPPMSFGSFLDQLNWSSIFTGGETLVVLPILIGAATLVGAYSMTTPVRGRLALALIGALAPAIALTERVGEFVVRWVATPYRAVSEALPALAGRGDGEFYVDGEFGMSAIGWWTEFWLVLVFRESRLLWRAPTAAEAGVAPNGGSATPVENSRVTEGATIGDLIR
jgi:hypothetical protein